MVDGSEKRKEENVYVNLFLSIVNMFYSLVKCALSIMSYISVFAPMIIFVCILYVWYIMVIEGTTLGKIEDFQSIYSP